MQNREERRRLEVGDRNKSEQEKRIGRREEEGIGNGKLAER